MANIKFTNFARSKVATGINSSATTLAITGGTGALFPALTGAEYFYLTLENSSLVREIVKVTARTADTLTIVRAQDGTTAAAWVAGDTVSLRFNALAITESIGNALQQTSAVGAALIPAGTTAERPTPAFGHQRANSTTGLMEWWNGTAWQNFATGAFAASGANSDITSLTGLTSPVSEVRQLQPITAAIASNAITITPSALSLEFRNTTLTNGAVSFIEGTPAALVIAASDSFGLVTAAGNQRIAILAINNSGTIELAASALSGGVSLDETGVITTATAATLGTHIKAANVRTGVAYRVIGFVDATFTTATGWGSLTLVQGTGGQALAAMSSLGYGQTWQTPTRAVGTTYYNTTGKPLQVNIRLDQTAGGAAEFRINGVSRSALGGGVAGYPNFVQLAIPPGNSYAVINTGSALTLVYWYEML